MLNIFIYMTALFTYNDNGYYLLYLLFSRVKALFLLYLENSKG